MNILFIADPGSIHNMNWMAEMGKRHTCFLLVRKIDERHVDPIVLSDNKVAFLGSIDDFSLRRYFRTRTTAKAITRLVTEHSIDIIHILYAEPNALWASFTGLFGCKVLITTRGTDVLKTIPAFAERKSVLSKWVAAMYRRAFRKCHGITSTSLAQQEAIKAFTTGIEVNKLHCIRTGIDIAAIDRAEAYKSDKPYVLFPRLMHPIYNHECAIAAIALLGSDMQTNYRFVFVDADTSNEEYSRLIGGLMTQLEAETVWLPRLQPAELYGWMKGAALCVMTPHSDGTSVSALEVLAAGSPLILPRLNYDQDIFGDTAHFFEPNNPEDLACRIIEVLSMCQSNAVSENSAKVRARASRSAEMDRLHALYLNLVAE